LLVATEHGRVSDSDPLAALSLLTEEPRLRIMETLAQADAEGPSQARVSFTELFEAQEIRDSGRFNYHLDKLCGEFVEKNEDGYRLSSTGYQLVAAVLSISADESSSTTEITLSNPCPVCETSVTVERPGDFVRVLCEQGHGFGETVPPRMAADRDLRTVVDLAAVRAVGSFREARRGLCPKCSGRMEWTQDSDPNWTIQFDTDVPSVGVCQTCGVPFGGSPAGFVFFEPPVIARLADLGFDVWDDPVEWWLRGEGGTVEDHDLETGVVTSTFEFPAFTLTATVTARTKLESFTLRPTGDDLPADSAPD
jgi:hypothetical protein